MLSVCPVFQIHFPSMRVWIRIQFLYKKKNGTGTVMTRSEHESIFFCVTGFAYQSKEFEGAGLSPENILSFRDWIGSEEMRFVDYHIRKHSQRVCSFGQELISRTTLCPFT